MSSPRPNLAPTWTPEQRRGIETVGRSLLVSAAAGSGKTAVLAARCAHLVCDAPDPCDVDQLLVVTFTDAAAAEMKARIERALRQRLAAGRGAPGAPSDDPRLERQLAMVERAQVSTLHGFCARLIRQNFHLLGLDPAVQLLDGDEQDLLRAEVARELLAARFEDDPSGRFERFVEWYGGGDDEKLIPHLLRTYELTRSLIDPAAWSERACRRIEEAASAEPLERTALGARLSALVRGRLASLARRCEDAARGIAAEPGLARYVQYLAELGATVRAWEAMVAPLPSPTPVSEPDGDHPDPSGAHSPAHPAGGLDALAAALAGFAPPRRPPVRGEVPGRHAAAGLIDAIRKEMTDGALARTARFSTRLWREGLAATAPMAREFQSLLDDFARRYRRAKDQARRIDFNDLEHYALRLLRDQRFPGRLAPGPIARACHKRFRHVLVDEYQDINELQDAILHLVSTECAAAEGATPNLFCVGDVKQSIYRFRLAEPRRFLARYDRFKGGMRREAAEEGSGFRVQSSGFSNGQRTTDNGHRPPLGEVIDLQANFRSRGPLLDSINRVFRRLMTRAAAEIEYDAAQELRPGAAYPAGPGLFAGSPIELHLLPDVVPAADDDEEGELERSEREAAFVARRIRQLLGLDGSPPALVVEKTDAGPLPRPVRFADVVILLRSMKRRADQYADVLRAAGIPVFREGGQGYFDSLEVRDMRSLLALLDNQQQDVPLAAVLRSPLAGLADPEDCLARIRIAYPNRQWAIGNRQSSDVPFHCAARRYAAEKNDELAARLRDLFERLARWRDLARHRPLAELIWAIYDQTGYLAFVEGLTNGRQRAANLVELHRRAAQFGTFARQGLYRFLRFLDSLEAETDFGQPSVLAASADVVRIMSVHQSKGLEFPVVFLPELGKRINLQDCRGPILVDRDAGLGLAVVDEARRARYPSLASVLVEQDVRAKALAEEMRILYVAMTRAKEHLVLSGTAPERRLRQWADLWSRHPGPLPAADVQAATSVLDWIGPVSAMTAPEGALAVTAHAPEEVARWAGADLRRVRRPPLLEKLARLEPLHPPPAPHPAATAVIDRLTAAYPHALLSRLPAARAVTDLAGIQHDPLPMPGPSARVLPEAAPEAPPRIAPPAALRRAPAALPVPRCLQSAADLSAADAGSATHTVLQHLDFARPCTGDDLDAQVAALVDRRLLTPAHAAAVDRPAIEWFVRSDLGRFLRARRDLLRREFDIHLAVPPDLAPAPGAPLAPPPDPRDQVMVRGRIDAVVIAPDALTLVDYKTDRLPHPLARSLADRVALHRPQLDLYRRALARITGRPVVRAALVFLAARQIVAV